MAPDFLATIYIDGLPFCRASYEQGIHEKARKDDVKLGCSLFINQATVAVEWLKSRGYNAYIRVGDNRSSLCEVDIIDGCDDYPSYDFNERWYPEKE